MKPSEYCRDIIQGRLRHDDAPAAIQSMMRLHYYQAASKIIAEPDKEKRRTMLTAHPDTYLNEVKKGVTRLWPLRNKLSK